MSHSSHTTADDPTSGDRLEISAGALVVKIHEGAVRRLASYVTKRVCSSASLDETRTNLQTILYDETYWKYRRQVLEHFFKALAAGEVRLPQTNPHPSGRIRIAHNLTVALFHADLRIFVLERSALQKIEGYPSINWTGPMSFMQAGLHPRVKEALLGRNLVDVASIAYLGSKKHPPERAKLLIDTWISSAQAALALWAAALGHTYPKSMVPVPCNLPGLNAEVLRRRRTVVDQLAAARKARGYHAPFGHDPGEDEDEDEDDDGAKNAASL